MITRNPPFPCLSARRCSAAAAGLCLFALDLRTAPTSGPVHDWLTTRHLMRYQHMYMRLIPLEAWDALIYIEDVTAGHVIRKDTY